MTIIPISEFGDKEKSVAPKTENIPETEIVPA
jgi:hypothetical protein